MSTVYTAEIEKNISFNDFIMGCARAFGALITMRDDPPSAKIPDQFEPSPYHSKRLSEARVELKKLQHMSLAEASAIAIKEFNTTVASHNITIAEENKLREKYSSMLSKVEQWTPPTQDHTELKSFMRKQIQESIEFDCHSTHHSPKLKTGAKWLKENIAKTLKDINYHETEFQKDTEIAKSRTLWIKQLRESLD